MDPNRKFWNQEHQKLQRALSTGDHGKAIELFLNQHAMVHSAKVSKTKLWSFEDEVLNDTTEAQIRCIPPGSSSNGHSIAWILFHLARIEDITMNMLVAGSPQLFVRDGWAKKLKVTTLCVHSGNQMDEVSVATLSAQIDTDALRIYRQSVGRGTRARVGKLKPEELKQKVESARLQKVMEEGALLPAAIGILNYWSKRTIAGLLLMPPTRHNFLHLNEALRIKQRLQRAK
jgi:hypothetical protein